MQKSSNPPHSDSDSTEFGIFESNSLMCSIYNYLENTVRMGV